MKKEKKNTYNEIDLENQKYQKIFGKNKKLIKIFIIDFFKRKYLF